MLSGKGRCWANSAVLAGDQVVKKFSKMNVLFYVLFQLTLIVGILLRFSDLAGRSLWLDEIWTLSFYNAAIPFHTVVNFSVHEYFPPLYNILLWGSFHLFGETVEVGRGFSAIFGVLMLPVFYLLTKEYSKNRWAGLVAMAAISFNPFLVHYSREMRGYSAMLFFSIAGYYFLLRFLQDKRRSAFIFWIVCLIVPLNIHFFSWLPCLHQLSWYLRTRSRSHWKHDFLKIWPMILAGLIFPFWVSVLVLKDFGNSTFISTWIGDLGTWLDRLSGTFLEWTGFPRAIWIYAFIAFFALFLVIKRSDRRLAYKENFFLIDGILILFSTFLIDYFYKPILIPRYFISVFCIFLVGSVGFLSQAQKSSRSLLLLLAFCLFSYDGVMRYKWQPWSNDYRFFIGWLAMQQSGSRVHYFGTQRSGIERYSVLLGVPVTLHQSDIDRLENTTETILVTSDQPLYITQTCPELSKMGQFVDRDIKSFFFARIGPGFKCKVE